MKNPYHIEEIVKYGRTVYEPRGPGIVYSWNSWSFKDRSDAEMVTTLLNRAFEQGRHDKSVEVRRALGLS